MLSDYQNKDIAKFLRIGWPISHDGCTYSQVCDNWKGANAHPVEVRK